MSKYLLHSLIALLILGTNLAAQSPSNEPERLRELLGLPSGKEIAIASSPKLVAGSKPLRVFLATGDDKRSRNYYAHEVKQWNRYKDANVSALEVVPDLSQADIILARYQVSDKVETTTSSTAVTYQDYDPKTRRSTPKLVTEKHHYRSVQVKGYVLRRVGQEIEILSQGVYWETRMAGKSNPLADMLWIKFTELLITQ